MDVYITYSLMYSLTGPVLWKTSVELGDNTRGGVISGCILNRPTMTDRVFIHYVAFRASQKKKIRYGDTYENFPLSDDGGYTRDGAMYTLDFTVL